VPLLSIAKFDLRACVGGFVQVLAWKRDGGWSRKFSVLGLDRGDLLRVTGHVEAAGLLVLRTKSLRRRQREVVTDFEQVVVECQWWRGLQHCNNKHSDQDGGTRQLGASATAGQGAGDTGKRRYTSIAVEQDG